MNKNNSFIAYILIGVGIYFLLKKFDVPFSDRLLSWPTILIIVGVALLFHSLSKKDYENILGGVIVLGLGIHFYGLQHNPFWIDHWAVYPGIIGIAIIIRSYWIKKGLFSGLILTAFAFYMIFSIQIPSYFDWIYDITSFIEKFWPILLVVVGVYLLRKK